MSEEETIDIDNKTFISLLLESRMDAGVPYTPRLKKKFRQEAAFLLRTPLPLEDAKRVIEEFVYEFEGAMFDA